MGAAQALPGTEPRAGLPVTLKEPGGGPHLPHSLEIRREQLGGLETHPRLQPRMPNPQPSTPKADGERGHGGYVRPGHRCLHMPGFSQLQNGVGGGTPHPFMAGLEKPIVR